MSKLGNFLLRFEERLATGRFQRPIEEFLRLPKWFRYGLLWLGMGGYFALFLLVLFWQPIETYRSGSLLEEARAALAEEAYQEAFDTARASLQVDPANEEAVRFVYELLREAGSREAFLWGSEVGKRDGFDLELSLELIETGLRYNMIYEVRPILLHLRSEAPENLGVLLASARIHLADGEAGRALKVIRDVLGREPENVIAHELALVAGLGSRDVEFLAELQPRWREFSGRTDELGLVAIRNLLRMDLTMTELVDQLEDHPLATRQDRILAANVRISRNPSTAEQVLGELEPAFDFSDPADRTQWVSLLAFHEQRQAILALVEDPSKEDSGRIAWEYVLALVGEEREEEALELLSRYTRQDLDLSEAQYAYLRSVAEGEVKGGYSAYGLTSVLRNSGPGDWALIERDLRKRGGEEGLLVFHEHISRSFEAPEVGNAFRLLRAYEAANEIEVRLILRNRPLADFARSPGTAAWLALYLRIILDIRVADLSAEVREIIPMTVNYPYYRNLIALLYTRMGDPAAALPLVEPLQVRIEDVPAFVLMGSAMLERELLQRIPDPRWLDYLEARLRLETEQKTLESLRR